MMHKDTAATANQYAVFKQFHNLGFFDAASSDHLCSSYTTVDSNVNLIRCQSSVAASDLPSQLGLYKHNLILVTIKMSTANNLGITTIGALPLRIT